tara:strand:- start:24 stop:524 length:501 start_codon:yes stop_codon:yes gene_type:complete
MDSVESYLNMLFENKYLSTALSMFLVFYSSRAAPKLPNFMVKLFENSIFRILVLSLIVYKGNRDPQFAIMIAVVFTITMNMVSKQKLFEGFTDIDPPSQKNIFEDSFEGDQLPVIDGMVDTTPPDIPSGPKKGDTCKVKNNGTDNCGDDMICISGKCKEDDSLKLF